MGGGDSALDEAQVLAEHAARVTVIHRGESLDAQQALQSKAAAGSKIAIVLHTIVEEIAGADAVSAVRLRDVATGTTRLQEVRGVFIYVGLEPNTAFLREALALDAAGHIETDTNMRTSLAGVFAAGDIRRHSVAQLAAAAGDGATAAIGASAISLRNLHAGDAHDLRPFRISSAMIAVNSCGVEITGSMPSLARLARISGERSPSLTTALSRSITAGGVPAGVTMPNMAS